MTDETAGDTRSPKTPEGLSMLISNRTSRLLCAGALVLATTALASCSTVMDTDRIYTPAVGVSERSKDVDVLNAVIVSSKDGEGTLVATLANNRTDRPGTTDDNVDQLTGVGGEVDGKVAEPVDIAAGGSVVLATATAEITTATAGVKVTGDFALGDFVTVTLTFANAGEITLDVPVVPNTEGTVFGGQDGAPEPAEENADHEDGGDHDDAPAESTEGH